MSLWISSFMCLSRISRELSLSWNWRFNVKSIMYL